MTNDINAKMKAKVGIVVPAYNAEKSLEKCLDSIIGQSYKNVAVAVINDGSGDNTWTVIEQYMKRNPAVIRGMDSRNKGVMEERFQGIRMLQDCKYIMFVDSDDYLCDSCIIEKCVHEFEYHMADMVSFNFTRGKGRGFKVFERKEMTQEDALRGMLVQQYLDGNMCGACYRYSYVLKHFQVRECNNDDYLNKAAFIRVCQKIIVLPDVGYYYTINPQSQTHRMAKESDYLYYEHAHEFCDSLRNEFPYYENECAFFEAWVLLWIMMQFSKHKKCRQYCNYPKAASAFKKKTSVYMKNPYFHVKDRMGYVFIRLHIFKIVNWIYQKVRNIYINI